MVAIGASRPQNGLGPDWKALRLIDVFVDDGAEPRGFQVEIQGLVNLASGFQIRYATCWDSALTPSRTSGHSRGSSFVVQCLKVEGTRLIVTGVVLNAPRAAQRARYGLIPEYALHSVPDLSYNSK